MRHRPTKQDLRKQVRHKSATAPASTALPHGFTPSPDRVVPSSQISKAIVEQAQIPQTGISLGYMREFGDQPESMKQHTLIAAATFLHRELPIRLAHRIVELDHLPYGLSETKGVTTVRNWYIHSFEELSSIPCPRTADDEEKFTEMITNIHRRHEPTALHISSGVQELRKAFGATDGDGLPEFLEGTIAPFLDTFFSSRIGIRVLIEQHVALHNPAPGWVGIIDKATCPHLVASDAIDHARTICERSLGVAPDVSIYGPEGFTFPYIPTHLHQMLFEVIKNSMRAVVEFHGDEATLPDVRVIISGSDQQEDVVIKVTDEGGGIPRSEADRIWSYFYTTAASAHAEDMGAFTSGTPLAGFGFGLPLSRLYARHSGGDLRIMSMEGYGTDAYLHLRLAGDTAEPVLGAATRSTAAFGERHV